jgi:hypothetical protein
MYAYISEKKKDYFAKEKTDMMGIRWMKKEAFRQGL